MTQEREHRGRLDAIGLLARGILYLVLGLLTAQLLLSGQAETDGQGAFDLVARQPLGPAILVALAVGLLAYAGSLGWSAVRGGDAGADDDVLPRLADGFRMIVYLGLGGLAISTLVGSGGSQGGDTQQLTAQLVQTTIGRVAVGLAGAIVIGVGVRQAMKIREEPDDLDTSEVAHDGVVRWIRTVALAGRALSFALIGGFLVHSAFTRDGEGGGLDVALQQAKQSPFGAPLLIIVSVGFVAFGVFCIIVARNHDERPGS